MSRFNKILRDKFKKEININQVAVKLGINPKTFTGWLNGKVPKLTEENIKALKSICEYFDIEIQDLLGINIKEKEIISNLNFVDNNTKYYIKIEKEKK